MLKFIKNLFRKKNNQIHSSEINISEEHIVLDDTENNKLEDETLISEAIETEETPNKTKQQRFSKIKSTEFAKKILSFFRLKKLDQYILKKFLGTYFFAIILFLAIVVMFDINEKLDAFITAPLKETILDYFLNFLPYFANQFSPLFVFISVIFFTSKMADNSEIIAILSSGVSFRRLLRPYMIGATVIAAITFVLGNYIIPPTNIDRINYTNKYVKNKKIDAGTNIQLMVQPGVVAYMARYDASS